MYFKMYFRDYKMIFFNQPLLQSSVSHDTSEIIVLN